MEGKCGWIIGGAKGYVGPPSQIIMGAKGYVGPPLKLLGGGPGDNLNYPILISNTPYELHVSWGSDSARHIKLGPVVQN